MAWWMLMLAGQSAAPAGDALADFDLAKVKGTADPCSAASEAAEGAAAGGGDVVVCGRRKNMTVPVKPIDWAEKPVRAELKLPGGVTASSTIEQRSPGPPGVSVPTPMVHFKIRF